ncbi:hypothetical protein VUN82_00390 [Micrococcaceae bacterium Sec5.1]
MSVRNSERPLLYTVMALSLALMLGGFFIGFQTNLPAGLLQGPASGTAGAPWWSVFGRILLVNLPALCLAFSGVVTGGISTLIAWPLTSIYIGATMRTATAQLGPGEVIGTIWVYAPAEFAALLIAAGAGLMPAAAAARAALSDHGNLRPMHQYLHAVPVALKTFCVAAVILVAAAAIESALITSKGLAT